MYIHMLHRVILQVQVLSCFNGLHELLNIGQLNDALVGTSQSQSVLEKNCLWVSQVEMSLSKH